jgi:tetratricopeptide (TPR) repeat protein
MHVPHLILIFLLAVCFWLATNLQGWYLNWQGNRVASGNLLAVLVGDSRRMFANHFFVKADAYFHSGYYPTIFDNRESFQTTHMSEDAGVEEGHNTGDEHDFLGKTLDWIDRINRQMFPSHHTHLDGREVELGGSGDTREILPWLAFSAELDPQRVETYVVSAYWLGERLGKVAEAEQFLRQGLRANPASYEILFELGRIHLVHYKDPAHARNLWELGLRRWRQQDEDKEAPDYFFWHKFTSHLAELEEGQGNLRAALDYWQMAKPHAPEPGIVAERIKQIELKLKEP